MIGKKTFPVCCSTLIGVYIWFSMKYISQDVDREAS